MDASLELTSTRLSNQRINICFMNRERAPALYIPFKAIVAPRPIGWIGTKSKGAVNLAPYSFFNAICDTPPMVMFSSSGVKDSVSFIEETGEFTANLVSDHFENPDECIICRRASRYQRSSNVWTDPDVEQAYRSPRVKSLCSA